jgi:uncharacterized membrane protein
LRHPFTLTIVKQMLSSLLFLHIAAGFSALGVGIIPMFSKKGSLLHRRAGLVFYWCMMLVAFSAVAIAILKPLSDGRLFLTGIAVFSFYLCFTGRRSLHQRNGTSVRWFDWGVLGLMASGALAMLGYGSYLVMKSLGAGSLEVVAVLFCIFGIFSGLNVLTDTRKYLNPETTKYGKREWFFAHIIRMSGSYIATLTAFTVVNVGNWIPDAPFAISILAWVGPGAIGGILIGRTVQYYLKKFATTQ